MLEVAWTGHYDVVYYAYSLHGVLGHVVSLVVIINLLAPMKVLQQLGSLHAFTTACLVAGLCYALKEFYLRRHHKQLLTVRLKGKLARMEEWSSILSMLGLSNVVAEEEEDDDDDEDALDSNGREDNGSHLSCGSNNITNNPMLQGDSSAQHFYVQSSRDGGSGEEANHSHSRGSGCGHCCFDGRSLCTCCLLPRGSGGATQGHPGGSHNTITSDEADTSSQFDEEKLEKKTHLSFWRQLDELRHGHLNVSAR